MVKQKKFPEIMISEKDNILSLHLETEIIQSSMNLKDPTELVLFYSQAMLGSLLFSNQISKISHIGLGGGSLVRWFDAFFPKIEQTAIEINPQVVHIAQSMFHLPECHQYFNIVIDDGYEWLKHKGNELDIIFIDAFDGVTMAKNFVSISFFENCFSSLKDQGVFVANWWINDKNYFNNIKKLKEIFYNKVFTIEEKEHGNVAVIAIKNPQTIKWETLKEKGMELSEKTNVDFLNLYYKLKEENPQLPKILKY